MAWELEFLSKAHGKVKCTLETKNDLENITLLRKNINKDLKDLSRFFWTDKV
jgi:hypothetical protein